MLFYVFHFSPNGNRIIEPGNISGPRAQIQGWRWGEYGPAKKTHRTLASGESWRNWLSRSGVWILQASPRASWQMFTDIARECDRWLLFYVVLMLFWVWWLGHIPILTLSQVKQMSQMGEGWVCRSMQSGKVARKTFDHHLTHRPSNPVSPKKQFSHIFSCGWLCLMVEFVQTFWCGSLTACFVASSCHKTLEYDAWIILITID